MKKSLFIVGCFMSSVMLAQPVIQDGSNRPSVGFTSPVSVSMSATSPGGAGANQTWDYSAVSFSPMGTMTVIDPTTSGYAASFPDANYCFILSVGGSTLYSYQNYLPAKMEELSSSIPAPQSGNDYSPDPPTRLIFPMSLGTTAYDTWQRTGGSVNDVTVTYDAYGTFVSPFNTYTGVVRVANDFGDNEVDYAWYTVNPLRLLAVHKHSDNTIVLIDGTGVGIEETWEVKRLELFPNPVNDRINISWKDGQYGDLTFVLFDVSGAKVQETRINATTTSIERGALAQGLYLYYLIDAETIVQSGKLNFN